MAEITSPRTAAGQAALRARFAQCDADGDGRLDEAQTLQVLAALPSHPSTAAQRQEVAQMVAHLDNSVDLETLDDLLRSVGVVVAVEPSLSPPPLSEGVVPERKAVAQRAPAAAAGLPLDQVEPARFSPTGVEPRQSDWKSRPPVPEPEPEPEPAQGELSAVHWTVYLRSRWAMVRSVFTTVAEMKKWMATKEGAGTLFGFAIFLLQHVLGQQLFAYAVYVMQMGMLWLPFTVLLLLLSPLPTPLIPFPYIIIWWSLSSWVEWPLLSILALALVVSGLSRVLPRRFLVYIEASERRNDFLDWLFNHPYRPQVDGMTYDGIDLSIDLRDMILGDSNGINSGGGSGGGGLLQRAALLLLPEGGGGGQRAGEQQQQEEVFCVTKYSMLTVLSGLWLLIKLLWPQSLTATQGAGSAEGSSSAALWISLMSFVLFVVTAHIQRLRTHVAAVEGALLELRDLAAIPNANAAAATAKKQR